MPPVSPALSRALAHAATQHGLITAAQCRDLGISRNTVQRLIARGIWTREASRVYRVVGVPRTWESRALAAVLAAALGPSCRTAAPHTSGASRASRPRAASRSPSPATPGPPGGRASSSTSRSRMTSRIRGAGGASRSPDRRGRSSTWPGAPRTCSYHCGPSTRSAASGTATWTELWEAHLAHACSGRTGIALARDALHLRDGKRVPDTEFPRLFLRSIAAAGLPEPASELEVTAGGRRYRLDCAYVAPRIDIELDGSDHLRPEVHDRDCVRDNQLELDGWLVLRFTWHRFRTRPDQVVDEVRAALEARAHR